MAGTVTTSEQRHSLTKKVRFDWTSSAGGAADATTTLAYDGEILRAVFIPGTAGTQPTNLYDVVVNDADGYDVLAATGADRSNAAPQTVVASLGAVAGQTLTLAVTNAGNAKTGSVILYIR